ncbi:MAG TPA: uroporphyrinogen-III C-methyltransferase [Burkholderiaceae bacterium]|nr:uroporphyrinogen-III C-methyltransferase [Burkholderiaceae bacterium]
MDMTAALALAASQRGSGGRVVLVGTGPGDPELLTLRAFRLIKQAEIALFDNLVAPQILELLPPDAERIYVGKRRNNHSMPQEQICALMVERARLGQCVLRLKGGDPFVFGRGGEEIASLAAAHVPFEVVPGITAAIGACAYSSIPLTHRDIAQACTFVTGQLQDGSIDLDWPALARARQTVVVYMGLLGLPLLCAKLIEHGRSPDTPAAIIQEATRPGQRVVVGTLASLPNDALRAGLRAPTVIVVGEVVALRRQLDRYVAQIAGG